MAEPQYEVFAIRYATREARRHEHFIGGDPHDGPMPMDYFVWVAKNAERVERHFARVGDEQRVELVEALRRARDALGVIFDLRVFAAKNFGLEREQLQGRVREIANRGDCARPSLHHACLFDRARRRRRDATAPDAEEEEDDREYAENHDGVERTARDGRGRCAGLRRGAHRV